MELNLGKEEVYHLKIQYRVGDMYSPKVEDREALALETQHFADCILRGEDPLTGGRAGLEVVKVLVAAEISLKHRGRRWNWPNNFVAQPNTCGELCNLGPRQRGPCCGRGCS